MRISQKKSTKRSATAANFVPSTPKRHRGVPSPLNNQPTFPGFEQCMQTYLNKFTANITPSDFSSALLKKFTSGMDMNMFLCAPCFICSKTELSNVHVYNDTTTLVTFCFECIANKIETGTLANDLSVGPACQLPNIIDAQSRGAFNCPLCTHPFPTCTISTISNIIQKHAVVCPFIDRYHHTIRYTFVVVVVGVFIVVSCAAHAHFVRVSNVYSCSSTRMT